MSDRPVTAQPLGVPAGMKPWAGGNSAPADWDGGPVLHRDGNILDGAVRDSIGWRGLYGSPPAFIAYTPLAPEAPKVAAGEVTRGDREAAADWFMQSDDSPIRIGTADHNGLVQAFRAHRTSAEAPLREALSEARDEIADYRDDSRSQQCYSLAASLDDLLDRIDVLIGTPS